MSSQSSANDTKKVGESSSHNYNTRLSVRKSMSAFSGTDRASNSSENAAPKTETGEKESLLSIYRRKSGEVEGEVPVTKNSRTKFSIFRRFSSVSSAGEEENSGDFSERKEGTGRGSSQILAVERRRSLYLEHDGCEGAAAYQMMNCGSFSRMDSSCHAENGRSRQQKICGLLPCLIALGAIIIIVVPLAKILGSLRSELFTIHSEMIDIKQHVGIDTKKSKESANLPREYSSAIKDLVKEELQSFGSDRVGKTDFALETAGGRIVKTVDTENYGTTVGFLGITLCEGNNGPRAMIQSSSGPGECWAFKGSKGTVIIKLLGKVRIDSVSLEHIPSKISPTGRLDTAPKDFEIYGLEDLKSKRILLGKFQYKLDSHPIQQFSIKDSCQTPFEFVEFHVSSNHGCAEYTCVYRLRVHGTLNSL